MSEDTQEGEISTATVGAGADEPTSTPTSGGTVGPEAGDQVDEIDAGLNDTGEGDIGEGDTGAGDTGTGDGPADGSGPEAVTRSSRAPSPYRRVGFAVMRALVVLVVAAVGYQLVVPTVRVERSRLARLVPLKPGVAAFNKTKPQAAEQNDSQTGVAAVTAAAKRSPNQTGIYSIQWVPEQTSGAGVVAFLLPSQAAAATALTQIRSQQLSAGSFSSSGLARASTFTVAAVPGSYGAVYAPSSASGAAVPGLAVMVFRYGRVVALTDVASSKTTDQAGAEAVTVSEYANLHHLGSDVGLTVTRRPVEATVLWVAGAVLLAAIAALTPVVRRRRSEKRRRAYEEEMANRVTVGHRVIVKHRR